MAVKVAKVQQWGQTFAKRITVQWMEVGLNGVNGQTVAWHVGAVSCHANGIVIIQRRPPAEDFARDPPKMLNRVTLQRYVLMKSVAMESFLVPVSFAVSRVKSSGLCLLFTNRWKRWLKNALALPRKKDWFFLLWKTLETVSVRGSFLLGVKPVQWLAILGSASKTFFLYTRLCCDKVGVIKYISHGDKLPTGKVIYKTCNYP